MAETDSDQSANGNWRDTLPENLRDAPWIRDADTPDAALGKIQHAAKLVGRSLRIPGEDASDDDRNAFYTKLAELPDVVRMPLSDDDDGINAVLAKLGKPSEYTEYKLPEPSEDYEWDETLGENLRKYAFEAGLTSKQFETLAGQIAGQEKERLRETNDKLETARAELRREWGDTLEDREALIRGWMDKSDAPEELAEAFENRNLDADTMKWLYGVAKAFKGDVAPISKGQEGAPAMTPQEARERIPKLIADMRAMGNGDPRYRDYQKNLVEAHRLANP